MTLRPPRDDDLDAMCRLLGDRENPASRREAEKFGARVDRNAVWGGGAQMLMYVCDRPGDAAHGHRAERSRS